MVERTPLRSQATQNWVMQTNAKTHVKHRDVELVEELLELFSAQTPFELAGTLEVGIRVRENLAHLVHVFTEMNKN